VLTLLLCLVVVLGLGLARPDLQEPSRRWVDVARGQRGAVDGVAARVVAVEVARQVSHPSTSGGDPELERTEGVLVVVRVEHSARDPLRLELHDRQGRRYWGEVARGAEPFNSRHPGTDLVVSRTLVFPVPPDAVDGATLEVTRDLPIRFEVHQWGLRLGLGLGPATTVVPEVAYRPATVRGAW